MHWVALWRYCIMIATSTRHSRRTELKMSMQCLRETLDAREFETRLTALRHTGRSFDASDLAEITMLRNRVDEIEEIHRVMRSVSSDDAIASCVASGVTTALLAVECYAQERGEQFDCTITNESSVDAWGWSESTREGDMNWRVTIRIIEESDL
jgi:hypothetical protein